MPGELEEIRRRYDAGELDPIKRDLERFIVAHRELIRAFRAEREKIGDASMTDELALKLYVIKQRTVNPQADILEQLREIEKEKWIRGVHMGRPPDTQEVALDWSRLYSAGWRAHRVTTIIYVFERERDRYLAVFHGPPGSP